MALLRPVAVRTVDLAQPLDALIGLERYPSTRVYVLDDGDPIGAVDIVNARANISATRLRDEIASGLGFTLVRRAMARALLPRGERTWLPPDVAVSIVLPTCDRPDDLRRCLASLAAQRTRRRVEIIVVDNRPGTGHARDVVGEFADVRLVEEARPGLSFARNRGIAESTGDIVVATDDDVVAPPEWVERLVAPFAEPGVMAVTGQVLPLELETEAQLLFEHYGGLGRGFERRRADGEWFTRFRAAVPTWSLGATANAAFRRVLFEDPAIGLLDEALGAGTPTGCSEDTLLFYRLLKRGHTLIYDPSAWVWHRHRRDMAALRRQIYGYSKGHVAYHLTTLVEDGDRRALVRFGWSLPKAYVRRALERIAGRSDYPLGLIALEIAGNLAGPWALRASRRRVRRLGPSGPLGRRAAAPAQREGGLAPPVVYQPAGVETPENQRLS